ncbi:MAG: mechanosensitive ion channel family protein [Thermoplasmata archaeon]
MKRPRPVLPLILLGLILLTSQLGQAQGLAEIFDVEDAYTKSLSAGQTISFVWLAYNRDTVDLLLRTQVDLTSGADWSASVAPRFVVLPPGGSTQVDLTVSSRLDAAERSITFTLTFALARAGDPVVGATEVRTATVNLVPSPPPLPTGNLILGVFDNPFPPPLNSRAVTFVINLAIWAFIAGASVLVVSPLVHRLARKTKTELDETILAIVRGPLILLLLTYGVVQSVAVLEPPIEVTSTLFLVYNVVLILTLTWLAYRLLQGIILEMGRKAAETREIPALGTLLPLIGRAGGILILVIGVASLAGLFGIDLTAFLLGAGVVGIAIAFAAQESLSNFFSGIFLMLDRPFREGDLVEIDGDRARVEKIGLRSTVLYHRPSSKLLVIPNNKMAREMIVNMVQPDQAIRQATTVGVEYGSDVETVKTILADAAKENPWVIKDDPRREPYARLEEFGDSALIYKLKFWVSDADKLNRVRGQVNESIVKRLTEAGIEIPAPQLSVTLEEGEGKTAGREGQAPPRGA